MHINNVHTDFMHFFKRNHKQETLRDMVLRGGLIVLVYKRANLRMVGADNILWKILMLFYGLIGTHCKMCFRGIV